MFKDNAFHLLSTSDNLRATFAPIESTEEALSYALVATDLMALYDLPSKLKGRPYAYLVNELEETHVEYAPEGYVVHLYAHPEPGCGCGFHVTAAVDVIVTEAGAVKELEPKPQFQLGLCAD
ncbi:hypothetical protein TFLX_00677 [Thermoflexales bacterium]|nr:hypothetical protein TFLX_00677 [Thermoflexales bacterium]